MSFFPGRHHDNAAGDEGQANEGKRPSLPRPESPNNFQMTAPTAQLGSL